MKRYFPVIALIFIIIIFQLTATMSGSEFFLTQLTMSIYYSLVIIGLSVLLGYAGQISLGHAAFFAMGGYTSAILTTINLANIKDSTFLNLIKNAGLTITSKNAYGADIEYINPWISLVIAVVITAAVAFLIGIPILKLKGHYLAMATLGLGIFVYRIVLGTRMFGEADGISEIPHFNLIGSLSVSGDPSQRAQNYYIAAFLVVIGIILLINLINSRVGRALRSIHGNEEAASAMGIDTARYKLAIFVLSAVYASVAGVFLTHFNGGIGPSEADVMKSVSYVAIVAVGGMSNIWGALFMGIVLNYLSLRGYFGSMDELVFGGILIVIMLFFPDGLLKKENFSFIYNAVLKIKNKIISVKKR